MSVAAPVVLVASGTTVLPASGVATDNDPILKLHG
jgi:hypothetical protein